MMACDPKSAGNNNLTAVWMSWEERVFLLLYLTSLLPSRAILSNMSVTKELSTFIPFLEIPMSLAMLFNTLKMYKEKLWKFFFLVLVLFWVLLAIINRYPNLLYILRFFNLLFYWTLNFRKCNFDLFPCPTLSLSKLLRLFLFFSFFSWQALNLKTSLFNLPSGRRSNLLKAFLKNSMILIKNP